MKYIKSNERPMFSFQDPHGEELLSWLRLNFSHLDEQKFRQNFKECVISMCGCGLKIESTEHFSCPAIFITLKDQNCLIASTT